MTAPVPEQPGSWGPLVPDGASAELCLLADTVAGIEQDAEFSPVFTGVWIVTAGGGQVRVALKDGPDLGGTIATLRQRYPSFGHPRCSVLRVTYSLGELEVLRDQFRRASSTRPDLDSVVVASGVAVQVNRFWICVLSSTGPALRAAIRSESGGQAALVTESAARWSTTGSPGGQPVVP